MTDRTPTGDLRERLAEALTREHYRRARERIEASLEEHCAAFADAVLSVVEAETAALRQRAEEAERERDDYRQRFTNQMAAADELIRELRRAERLGAEALDAVAAERRDKLAAQAAVRRVRELADAANAEAERSLSRQFGGHPFPPFVSVADIRAALDAEQPEEGP